jgi:cytochrome c
MKKTIVLFSFIAFIASCGNNNTADKSSDTEGKSSDAKTETSAAKPEDPEAEKGMNLIAKSDCLTCHQIEVKTTGPAYVDVAAKYPNNDAVVDSLADKVIKGGAGNWGTVPMTPHPSLSQDDAKAMVKYVLSLKK